MNPSTKTFTIELPVIGDEVFIGPMHLQAWKETYVTPESGVTEALVDELVGHIATKTGFRKNTLTEALAHPEKVFYRVIKNDKGNIVGFFHCAKTDTANVLEGVYLLNEVKGSGVGTKLMEEFLLWSDKDKESRLEVFSFNDRAMNFYKKFGFKEVEGSTQLYKEKIPFIEMVRPPEKK